MTGEVPFTTTPVLPVVPLPAPGESLGSWIAVIAGLYGVTLAEYLGRLGIPRRWITPTIGRDLVIRPLPGVIRALQADTGIAKASLLRMTFSGLERDLEEACRRHDVPCAECENETAQRAGRPVALLHTWAAWRVVCPHHPPCPGPADLEAG